MSVKKVLGDIPVVVEREKPSQKLHLQRRIFQISVLILILVIPISGLFRIDPVAGAFVVLDRQIWFADFMIVFGFWITTACLLVIAYSLLGTAFCGWACPQNSLSEWANNITHKLLGKRADVSLDGSGMRVAPAKNKLLNWCLLVLLFVLVSMAFAVVPLFYFYPPAVVWSFVSLQQDMRLAGSLYWIYAIFVLIIFINVTMIRHFMCRFMCIYKVWQHTFRTSQTLHIAYDSSRSAACEKCNYCKTACYLALDPRDTGLYDSCNNCGECITACQNVQAHREGGMGLLRFVIGERSEGESGKYRTNLHSLFARVAWSFPLFLLGAIMFVWGLATYDSYHFSAYRADNSSQAAQVVDYRISAANKIYQPAQLDIRIEGLPEGSYQLASDKIIFDTAERKDVKLRLNTEFSPGLHPFIIHLKSDDGWQDSFRIHHFVATGSL